MAADYLIAFFKKKTYMSAFQEILHGKLSDASNADKLEREAHVLLQAYWLLFPGVIEIEVISS